MMECGEAEYRHTSPNTAYTAHFIRRNLRYAETSYMPGALGDENLIQTGEIVNG